MTPVNWVPHASRRLSAHRQSPVGGGGGFARRENRVGLVGIRLVLPEQRDRIPTEHPSAAVQFPALVQRAVPSIQSEPAVCRLIGARSCACLALHNPQ
jgi:hypothetical protein